MSEHLDSVWQELNSRAVTLQQEGKYAEGVDVAKKALQVASK